jgi:hypothetical protein
MPYSTSTRRKARRAAIPSGLFNSYKAAAFLGVREHTLRQYRVIGRGPDFIIINGKPYYQEPDLVAFRAERIARAIERASRGGAAQATAGGESVA